MNEGDGTQHLKMKEKVQKECYCHIRLVLESELNASHKVNAIINSLTIWIITYSFSVLKWSITDISHIDMKIKKFLTKYQMHHPKADIDRLYLPRKGTWLYHKKKKKK